MDNTLCNCLPTEDTATAYEFCPWQVQAMAYVPVQQLETVFGPVAALDNGTLFPELCKPWYGGCCHE